MIAKNTCVMVNVWVILISGAMCDLMEYYLIQNLTTNYDVNVRPVSSFKSTVKVYIGLALSQIVDLASRQQILTTSVWLRLTWKDEHLQWNASVYGGLNEVHLSPGRIWKPDITVMNDVMERNFLDQTKYYPAIIKSSGVVQWNTPLLLKSSCHLNVRYFPWDLQACQLRFSSWTYPEYVMTIYNSTSEGDLQYFTPNGEWDLIAMPVIRHEKSYEAGVFPDVTFWMVLERRPLYYLFNLMLPCIFITSTAMLVFYLPPESGEKVNMGVTVLLALTVFLLLVAESMPPQSKNIPLAGEYFAAVIILLALSTAMTVVVLNFKHRGVFGDRVPPGVRMVILNILATIVCLKGDVDRHLPYKKKEPSTLMNVKSPRRKTTSEEQSGESNYVNGGTRVQDQPKRITISLPIGDNNELSDVATTTSSSDEPIIYTGNTSEKLLSDIKDILLKVQKEREDKKDVARHRTEWQLVALVLDRFFLILFVLLTVIVSLTILLNHPSYDASDWPIR